MGTSAKTWPDIEYATRAGRPTKYPWTEWFDGGIWKLEQGVDFDPVAKNFQVSIRNTAKKMGYTVEIRRPAGDATVLYIQATEVEGGS